VIVYCHKKNPDSTRFDDFRLPNAATYQVTQGTKPTPMQVVALWKAFQYPDNCFHANNRFNSNFNFVMKGGLADDDNERLIQSPHLGAFFQLGDLSTRRKCVNRLVETVLRQVNKGKGCLLNHDSKRRE
jgi:hypothetical protein